MKLIVIGSNSAGNAYALDAGGKILLLEAGMKLSDVKRAIGFRVNDVVGCVISHEHGDHAKYATTYAKNGIKIYCNQDVAEKKSFPFNTCTVMRKENTISIGSFIVTPFEVAHDVPCFGYLIMHPDMGILLFATDTYQIPIAITGIDHYLIEANYSDELLKENVWNGKVDKAQADRIMLSHMSLDYTVKYLRDCSVGSCTAAAKTITLCHLSERNSDPDLFRRTVEQSLATPCYIARKGLVIDINKGLI